MKKNYKDLKKVLRKPNIRRLSKQHSRKYQPRKCQVMMIYMDCGLKYSCLSMRLALELSRYLEEAYIPEWMVKDKNTLIQKYSQK